MEKYQDVVALQFTSRGWKYDVYTVVESWHVILIARRFWMATRSVDKQIVVYSFAEKIVPYTVGIKKNTVLVVMHEHV